MKKYPNLTQCRDAAVRGLGQKFSDRPVVRQAHLRAQTLFFFSLSRWPRATAYTLFVILILEQIFALIWAVTSVLFRFLKSSVIGNAGSRCGW
jgi:hypothetical protein